MMRTPITQRGFSLIELMIAITLSLVLVAGAMQLMLSTNTTYEASDDLSRAQESGRFALSLMSKDIRMAGYSPKGADLASYVFTGNCGGSNPCTDNDVAGAPNNSDRIAVQYDPPPNTAGTIELDCIGDAVQINNKIANVYWVEADNNGLNRLMCRGFDVTANAWVNPAGSAQALIEGVDSLQVLYGVGGVDGVSRYVSAANVDDWTMVKAIRVAVLVGTSDLQGAGRNKEREFMVLDNPTLTFNDSRSRYIYGTTIRLNNTDI